MTQSSPILLRLTDFTEPERTGLVLPINNDNGDLDPFASLIIRLIMSEPRNEVKRKLMSARLKAGKGEEVLQRLLDTFNNGPGPRALVSEGKVLAMRPTNEPFQAQQFINPVLEILLRSKVDL